MMIKQPNLSFLMREDQSSHSSKHPSQRSHRDVDHVSLLLLPDALVSYITCSPLQLLALLLFYLQEVREGEAGRALEEVSSSLSGSVGPMNGMTLMSMTLMDMAAGSGKMFV